MLMQLIRKQILLKLKYKNKGNTLLCDAIDGLIETIESKTWTSKEAVLKNRPDADQVHSDGFYFFDINIHRTLILIEFEANGEATIVWAGTHKEYDAVFKNNKTVIKKWLGKQGWI
jgi:mRNA-degrading endonuclease HigB of HigAB toxin-antitoxin module